MSTLPQLRRAISSLSGRSVVTTVQNLESQTFKLPDGRTLGFAEYGDHKGYPLFFFHGFPSSRLEGKGVAKLAERHRVRLICADRPGFGLSTFQPERRIVDWPDDVKALAAHLDVERLAIVGGSGGGPYAVACAHNLPPAMLSDVVLLASAGPWESGKEGVPWPSYLLYLAVTYMPWMTRLLLDPTVNGLKWLARTGPVTSWLDGWLRQVDEQATKKSSTKPAAKEEEPSVSERREQILKLIFESFTQGSGAFVQEAQLLSLPWGFKLEDVKYDQIEVWHGLQDWNVPIRQIRWMAERLPHCKLHEVEGNHFEVANNLKRIFEKIGSQKVLKESKKDK